MPTWPPTTPGCWPTPGGRGGDRPVPAVRLLPGELRAVSADRRQPGRPAPPSTAATVTTARDSARAPSPALLGGHDRVTDETRAGHGSSPRCTRCSAPPTGSAPATGTAGCRSAGSTLPAPGRPAWTPGARDARPRRERRCRAGCWWRAVGQGTYVYTGLSFFRQLPAGVPGAFRLFANLLALGRGAAPPRAVPGADRCAGSSASDALRPRTLRRLRCWRLCCSPAPTAGPRSRSTRPTAATSSLCSSASSSAGTPTSTSAGSTWAARRSSTGCGSSGSIRRPMSGSAGRPRSSTAASRDSLLAPYRPSWAGHGGPRGHRAGRPLLSGLPDAGGHRLQQRGGAASRGAAGLGRCARSPRWRDQVLIRDPMASGTMRAIWGLIIERSLRRTGDTAAGMAWLRRLDGQTRAYALIPAILDAKLARQEGLVTLWDLPDILISQQQGDAVRLRLPRERHGGHRRCDRRWSAAPGTRRRRGRSSTSSGSARGSCSPREGSSGCRPGTTCRRTGSRRGWRRWSGHDGGADGLGAARARGRGVDGLLGPARAGHRREQAR